MMQMRFCDGTEVPKWYADFTARMVRAYCLAEEMFGADELEAFVRQEREAEVAPTDVHVLEA